MKTWICKACGYKHYDDVAPDRCPMCGASKLEFIESRRRRGCGVASVMCATTVLLAIIAVCMLACCGRNNVDNSVVKDVDVYRYLGKWYEIARLDHKFERGMELCRATYTLENDGKIKVINQGKKNGKWKTSEARVKLTDEPGVLRVSFWGPFYSDYRILVLAVDYSYALVGGSGDDYLWILSRTPRLRKETCEYLVNEAQRRGYDTDKLIWVNQKASVK